MRSAVTPRAVGSGLISDSDNGAVRVSKSGTCGFFFNSQPPSQAFGIRNAKIRLKVRLLLGRWVLSCCWRVVELREEGEELLVSLPSVRLSFGC